MHRTGAIVLLPFVALVLLPHAAADDTLPPTLRVIADDDYTIQASVGTNASFAWTLVNVGPVSLDGNVTVSTSSPEYTARVEPASFSLARDEIATIYANVTIPFKPRSPTVDVEVLVTLLDGRHAHLTARVAATAPVQIVDLFTAFLAIGAIIFIGFFATVVFERTKVPDLIFLIALGLFLGPILGTFFAVQLIPLSLLELATPYFAAVALMIILFDGGLNLNLRQVVSRAGVSLVHTVLTWFGTVFVVTLLSMTVLGFPLWVGVLLGTVLGGTSGAVVIGVVRGMTIREDTKTILVLESTITDVLSVIGALTVLGILRGGGTLAGTIGGLLTAFSVALLLGAIAGILWLRVMRSMVGRPFGFMLTIAALFILYAGTEVLGGSGGMAALVFGLILGNHRAIGRVLKIKEGFRLDESFKRFQSEISFGIRTFFFVFLGFSFTFPFAATWSVRSTLPVVSFLNDTFWLVLLAIVLIFLGIWGVRVFATGVTVRVHPESAEDRTAIRTVMGRGLAAAVLASLPFAIPAFTDPADPAYTSYHGAMAGFETPFLTIAFLIILLTVIATTIGVVAGERRRAVLSRVPPSAMEDLGWRMTEELKAVQKELDSMEKGRDKEQRRIEQRPRAKRRD